MFYGQKKTLPINILDWRESKDTAKDVVQVVKEGAKTGQNLEYIYKEKKL